MPKNKVQKFNDYRSEMNDKILSNDNKVIKRIFNLDTNAFKKGHLPVKTKELMGLVASAVLPVSYTHLTLPTKRIV